MKKFILLTILVFTSVAQAHKGPTYPILKDLPVHMSKLSIWADPDLNVGKFLVVIDGDDFLEPAVRISGTHKMNPGKTLESFAVMTENAPGHKVFSAELPFDQEQTWNMKFIITSKNYPEYVHMMPVEVIPEGPNKLEFAIYFMPFLLLGTLGARVLLAKRKKI